MGFLSIAVSFIGYVLVYGSVANHGRFATEPWSGLFADAYTGETLDNALGGTVGRAGKLGSQALGRVTGG